MNARQDDFFCAARERRVDVFEDVFERTGTRRAASNRRDAKGAGVVAAVLGFDEGAGASASAGEGFADDGFKVEGFRRNRKERGDEGVFFAVWDDLSNAGERGGV